MKKKFLIILACVALIVCVALTGCASTGAGYRKVKVLGKPQDTSYTVYSNGGNSVQYGNYVYFINGTKGYEDADQKQNVWGDVVKGALYRAELSGTPSKDVSGDFDIAVNNNATYSEGLEFVIKDGEQFDYDDNPIDVVNVQLIAPKVIGTSGYKDGGIFIFGEWVYYASPNNERDKTGAVQIAKTDFMRSKLDGSSTQKIYTTDADSATSPYAFYCFGDKVYLVCYFNSKVVSVEVGNKIGQPATLASNVTGALLPYNTTYKKGMNTNTLQDFVYILRNTNSGDSVSTGKVIEVLRPYPVYNNGSVDENDEGFKFYTGSDSVALEGVRDGMLFYREANAYGTLLQYDNLHENFMRYSGTYKAYQNSLNALADSNKPEDVAKYNAEKVMKGISGTVFSMEKADTYTMTYSFRPGGVQSDIVYSIATNATGAYLKSNVRDEKFFYNVEMTFSFVEGEYVYFTDKDAKVLYRTEWNKAVSEKSEAQLKEKISHGDMTDNGLRPDYCAGYIVYFGKVDEWADGYAFFKKIDGVEGADEVYAGEKIEADIKPADEEEEEEEVKGCASTVVTSVSGGIAAGAAILLLGGALLFMAYRPKKDRR